MEFLWLQNARSIQKQASNMCNVITFELGHPNITSISPKYPINLADIKICLSMKTE